MHKHIFYVLLSISSVLYGMEPAEFSAAQANKSEEIPVAHTSIPVMSAEELDKWLRDGVRSLKEGLRFSHAPAGEEEWNVGQQVLKEDLEPTFVDQVIAGAPAAVQRLVKRLVESTRKPQRLLLVGSPGTGKTTLARAIACKAKLPYTWVCCSAIENEYQASGSQNLIRLFNPLIKANKPHVLILDEMNYLFDAHAHNTHSNHVTAAELWHQIDRCNAIQNILFIGTMNSVQHMPPQISDRFSLKIVTMPEIDVEGMIQTFKSCVGESEYKRIDSFNKSSALGDTFEFLRSCGNYVRFIMEKFHKLQKSNKRHISKRVIKELIEEARNCADDRERGNINFTQEEFESVIIAYNKEYFSFKTE